MAKHQTLGDNVIPSRYTLVFEPDLKTFKTTGSETIECTVRKETTRIILNSKEIEIKSATVKSNGATQSACVNEDKELERVELVLATPVEGPIEIEIDFTCINNDKMYGFYRSTYEVDKKQKTLLSSQFEAANARAAFPCFDEPEFKAVFKLSMKIDKNLSSISNMPALKEISSQNKKLIEFDETPKMSSYLLYLSVGEFEIREDKVGKLIIRVITTPGKGKFTELPMQYAKESVKWLQEYFGIDYPLPKLDFIAIPDFAAGAMENWGAITFREIALLGEEKTALSNRQYIASVIAHETVHQWFGDLVTMKWWDDIWLNESFAEFMSNKCMDELHPDWDFGIQYIENTVGTAFAADALKSTHPISVDVADVGAVDSVFDAISYQKGGSILRMLEDFVGKEIFKDGLHRYLEKHAYSNATKHDLWDAIQEASGKKIRVSDIIESWVMKPGHPLIHVKEVPGGFSLEQERYMLLGSEKDNWPIPLHYLDESGVSTMLMKEKTQKLKGKNWVMLNYGQKGFYKVKYEGDLLDKIGKLIKEDRISDIDAWGVENDMFAFVRSARITVDDYIDFVEKYCMDKGYPTNSSISSHFTWLCFMGYEKKFGERARIASIRFHKKMLSELGWERKKEDGVIETQLRSGAIGSLGLAGDKDTLARAKKEFDSFVKDGKEIDANIRGAIYALNAWQDGKFFDLFLKRYKEEPAPDERRRNLMALGRFSDSVLLYKTLELSDSDEVRLQDSFLLPAMVSRNPIGKPLIWGWTKKKWKSFMGKYDSGTHMLAGFVDDLAAASDEKTFEEIRGFFEDKKNRRSDMEMELSHTLEKIETNIKFMEKNSESST